MYRPKAHNITIYKENKKFVNKDFENKCDKKCFPSKDNVQLKNIIKREYQHNLENECINKRVRYVQDLENNLTKQDSYMQDLEVNCAKQRDQYKKILENKCAQKRYRYKQN